MIRSLPLTSLACIATHVLTLVSIHAVAQQQNTKESMKLMRKHKKAHAVMNEAGALLDFVSNDITMAWDFDVGSQIVLHALASGKMKMDPRSVVLSIDATPNEIDLTSGGNLTAHAHMWPWSHARMPRFGESKQTKKQTGSLLGREAAEPTATFLAKIGPDVAEASADGAQLYQLVRRASVGSEIDLSEEDVAAQRKEPMPSPPLNATSIYRDVWQTVPKISKMSERADHLHSSWSKGSRFKVHLYDDAGMDAIVQEASNKLGSKCSNVSLWDAYKALPLGVMKADTWRYAVLWLHGGIYADIDVGVNSTEVLQLWLSEMIHQITGYECRLIVGLENDVHFCQWVMAGVQQHPVLEEVLCQINRRALHIDNTYEHFVHKTTGPGVWTDAIKYSLNYTGTSARDVFEKVNAAASNPVKVQAQRLGLCLADEYFPRRFVSNEYMSQWSSEDRGQLPSWTKERSKYLRRAAEDKRKTKERRQKKKTKERKAAPVVR